jgi:hypothetical protein
MGMCRVSWKRVMIGRMFKYVQRLMRFETEFKDAPEFWRCGGSLCDRTESVG